VGFKVSSRLFEGLLVGIVDTVGKLVGDPVGVADGKSVMVADGDWEGEDVARAEGTFVPAELSPSRPPPQTQHASLAVFPLSGFSNLFP
jgi:hypothetical protein